MTEREKKIEAMRKAGMLPPEYETDEERDDYEKPAFVKNREKDPSTVVGTTSMMVKALDDAVDFVLKNGAAKDENRQSIYDVLEEEITSSDIPESEKVKKLSYLLKLRNRSVNILVTGATGVGKSSTINALFNTEIAKVGMGVDPETSLIECYELDNLTIWDTPGLGDNVEKDKEIKRQIIAKLNEMNEEGEPLIDMALVILDASSKDLGTTFDLINNALIPCFEGDAQKRILVALNQSDIAMKGAHWDKEKNTPDEVLEKFLEKKTASVGERIREATGLDIEPVYFCAGYMEGNDADEVRRPYNLTKLLYHIVRSVPKEKRLAFIDNLSEEQENWSYDDKKSDYLRMTGDTFIDSVCNSFLDGADDGRELGDILFGIPGGIIGSFVGGAYGVVRGVIGTLVGERY